jgi:hypothetical protein
MEEGSELLPGGDGRPHLLQDVLGRDGADGEFGLAEGRVGRGEGLL